jgi:hypothetical protein
MGIAVLAMGCLSMVDGNLRMAGDEHSRIIAIVLGIFFQLAEPIFFIVSADRNRTRDSRLMYFASGVVLMILGVTFMTMGQNAAVNNGAIAQDSVKQQIQDYAAQIASLQTSIESLQPNADQQSRSIYRSSREHAPASLARASELMAQRAELSKKMVELTSQRKTTAYEAVAPVANRLNLSSNDGELYLTLARSIMIDVVAILLIALATHGLTLPKLLTSYGAAIMVRESAHLKSTGASAYLDSEVRSPVAVTASASNCVVPHQQGNTLSSFLNAARPSPKNCAETARSTVSYSRNGSPADQQIDWKKRQLLEPHPTS